MTDAASRFECSRVKGFGSGVGGGRGLGFVVESLGLL